MPPLQKVKVRGDRDTQACPTCGFPVRVIRRNDGYADHYEHLVDEAIETSLAPQDPITAAELRLERQGKRTLAIVGMAPSTCALAPYDDPDVDIWVLNEMHAFPWMKRATAWFQMHPRNSFEREVAVRNVRGHYEWLQQEHGFPIYMQFEHDDIPDSVEYPLHAVIDHFFGRVRRGKKKTKYFSSGFNYMMALALHLGVYQRIEIYGFEMAGQEEYAPQRPGAYLWLGVALGMIAAGVDLELYLPPRCQLLWGALYGYRGHEYSTILDNEDD